MVGKRRTSEARELGRKGGKASGKARRKKANLKKALNTILTAEATSKTAAVLESLGFENTNEMVIVKVVDDPKLKSYYRYLAAIESTLKEFDEPTRQIIGDKYWGPDSWMTWAKFGEKVNYSPRQLYRLRDKVIELFAEKLGEDL